MPLNGGIMGQATGPQKDRLQPVHNQSFWFPANWATGNCSPVAISCSPVQLPVFVPVANWTSKHYSPSPSHIHPPLPAPTHSHCLPSKQNNMTTGQCSLYKMYQTHLTWPFALVSWSVSTNSFRSHFQPSSLTFKLWVQVGIGLFVILWRSNVMTWLQDDKVTTTPMTHHCLCCFCRCQCNWIWKQLWALLERSDSRSNVYMPLLGKQYANHCIHLNKNTNSNVLV